MITEKNSISFKIRIRPYVETFLEEMALYYEIYVFTAASKGYA
jgi:TFIIF-interacting CTD phosphatase-like protein